MKVQFGISTSEDVAAWLQDAAEAWSLSRSAVVEFSVRTLRRFIGELAAMTQTDQSRAVVALRSFQAGVVPEAVDLEALARLLQKEETGEAPP